MKHCTIYQTTNVLNGKTYIGKHITDDPMDDYLGSGVLLNQAILKYGRENFFKEVLFDFRDEKSMNDKEAELVTEEFCSKQNNYNVCPGGIGGWKYVNGRDEVHESRRRGGQKTVKLLQSDPLYKEIRSRRSSKSFLGRKHSEETLKKMRASKSGHGIGQSNSQFGTFWITNGFQNAKIKSLDSIPKGWYKGRVNGPVAQSGERLHGMQEADGS